jgi:S1-C subfamily serine protease
MKRLLLVLIASLCCLTPLSALSKWTPVSDKLETSVVYIEIFDGGELSGACTGFIIDSVKRHVLTASHCDGEKILADGTPTYKLYKDERKDLMVLRASQIEGPAVKMASAPPDRGDEVASMGFGFSLEDPLFRIAHVSNVGLEIESLSGPFNALDAQFIGGQSGGPVVNDKGELVMIVQRSASGLGIGVGVDVIKNRVGKYFGQ